MKQHHLRKITALLLVALMIVPTQMDNFLRYCDAPFASYSSSALAEGEADAAAPIEPAAVPVTAPTEKPKAEPINEPKAEPTTEPKDGPKQVSEPAKEQTVPPGDEPTDGPTEAPATEPVQASSAVPIEQATPLPDATATTDPTWETVNPVPDPTDALTATPSIEPTPTIELTEEPTVTPAVQDALFKSGYAKVKANTTVYDARNTASILGTLEQSGYIYVIERYGDGESDDWLQVAFAVKADGDVRVKCAYLRADRVDPVDVRAISDVVAALNAPSKQEDIAHYQGNLQQPLAAISFTPEEGEKDEVEPSPTEAPASETPPTDIEMIRTALDGTFGEVITDHAAVYAQPSIGAKQLGLLDKDGQTLLHAQVEASGSMWYEVTFGGAKGYVHSVQLRQIAVQPTDGSGQIDTTLPLTDDEANDPNQIEAILPLATPTASNTATSDEATPATDDEAAPTTDDEAVPATAGEAAPATDDEAAPATTGEATPNAVLLSYYNEETLLFAREVAFAPESALIPLWQEGDQFAVYSVADELGNDLPIQSGAVDAAGYASLDVYVIPYAYLVQVYYKTADDEPSQPYQFAVNAYSAVIPIDSIPAMHSVTAIVDGKGTDLIEHYDAQTQTLTLENVQADADLYITVAPLYARFVVQPYFERLTYESADERFERGTPTDAFPFGTDIEIAASQVELPTDKNTLDEFTYSVVDAAYTIEGDLATYSVYYERVPAAVPQMVIVRYIADGVLHLERLFTLGKDDTTLNLLDAGDSFTIVRVATVDGEELPLVDNTLDAAGHDLLIAEVVLAPAGIDVTYSMADGQLISTELAMPDGAAIQLHVPDHYAVSGLSDGMGEVDLLALFDVTNGMLQLPGEMLSEITVTLVPLYDGFIIQPYFEKLEYAYGDGQFDMGSPTEVLALTTDLETAATMVTLLEGELSLDAFIYTLDDATPIDITDGIATYSVYYLRDSMNMFMMMAGADAIDTKTVYLDYYDTSNGNAKLFTRSYVVDSYATDVSIILINPSDVFTIKNVKDESGTDFSYNNTEYKVDVSPLADDARLSVYVDVQNFSVTVYYYTEDGKLLASDYYPTTTSKDTIALTNCPEHYTIKNVSSDIGSKRLTVDESGDIKTIQLGILTADAVIHIELVVSFEKFYIVPHYEKADVAEQYDAREGILFERSEYSDEDAKAIISDDENNRPIFNDTPVKKELVNIAEGVATYNVYYLRKTYLFSFDANEGYFTSTDFSYTQKLRVGQTVPVINDVTNAEHKPERVGYEFDGWEYDGIASDGTTMPANNVILKAKWKEATIPVLINYYYQDIPEVDKVTYSFYASSSVKVEADAFLRLGADGGLYYTNSKGKKTTLVHDAPKEEEIRSRPDYQYFDYSSGIDKGTNGALEGKGVKISRKTDSEQIEVINIYYNRNQYTINFSMDMYRVVVGSGKQYASMKICGEEKKYEKGDNSVYLLSNVYYEQDVSSVWPAGVNVTDVGLNDWAKFHGWNRDYPTYLTWVGVVFDGVEGNPKHYSTMNSEVIKYYFTDNEDNVNSESNEHSVTVHAVVRVFKQKPSEYAVEIYRQLSFEYDDVSGVVTEGQYKHEDTIYEDYMSVENQGEFNIDNILEIKGFSKPTSTPYYLVEGNTHKLYYNRKKYNLILDANGGEYKSDKAYFTSSENLDYVSESQIKYPDPIEYEADLGMYGFTGSDSGENIVPERQGHSFEGWYTTELLNKRANWDCMKPINANDESVTYYAKWEKDSYDVTVIDPLSITAGSDGVIGRAKDISYLDPIPTFVDMLDSEKLPERPGYTLVGWYTLSSTGEKIWYTDRSPILGDTTIYANWEAKGTVEYTVKHIVKVQDGDDTVLETVQGSSSDGLDIDIYPGEYFDDDSKPYIPDAAIKSVTLKPDEENVFEFYYTLAPEDVTPKYYITCVDSHGTPINVDPPNIGLIDDTIYVREITIWDDVAKVRVNYKPGDFIDSPESKWVIDRVIAPYIPGYEPITFTRNNILLSGDEKNNQITFVYRSLGDVDYIVNYYDYDDFGELEKTPLNLEEFGIGSERVGAVGYVVEAETEVENAKKWMDKYGYVFVTSTITRDGVETEREFPTLTLDYTDKSRMAGSGNTVPTMNVYIMKSFIDQPQSVLQNVNEDVVITALISGNHNNDKKFDLLDIDGDPVKFDYKVELKVVEGGKDKVTEIKITATELEAKDAGEYYIAYKEYKAESSTFVISLWDVEYSSFVDDHALYSSIVTQSDEPNDTAKVIFYSGYPAAVETELERSETSQTYDFAKVSAVVTERTSPSSLPEIADKTIAIDHSPQGMTTSSTWEVKMYNYNNISEGNDAKVYYELTVKSPEEYPLAEPTATIPLRVVLRLPDQINVSVPLVLVAQVNIDGGDVHLENESYMIKNLGLTPIKVTSISTEAHSGFNLVDDAGKVGDVPNGKVYLAMQHDGLEEWPLVPESKITETGIVLAASQVLPIKWHAKFSPLDFITIQNTDGSVDTSMGVHVATVTYTVALATDVATQSAAP